MSQKKYKYFRNGIPVTDNIQHGDIGVSHPMTLEEFNTFSVETKSPKENLTEITPSTDYEDFFKEYIAPKGFRFQLWNEWGDILSKDNFNWLTFTPFHLAFERGSYKGSYFEVTLTVFGFGVVITKYEE